MAAARSLGDVRPLLLKLELFTGVKPIESLFTFSVELAADGAGEFEAEFGRAFLFKLPPCM